MNYIVSTPKYSGNITLGVTFGGAEISEVVFSIDDGIAPEDISFSSPSGAMEEESIINKTVEPNTNIYISIKATPYLHTPYITKIKYRADNYNCSGPTSGTISSSVSGGTISGNIGPFKPSGSGWTIYINLCDASV